MTDDDGESLLFDRGRADAAAGHTDEALMYASPEYRAGWQRGQSPREYLLGIDGPAVGSPIRALEMLADLAAEPAPATAHEWAGNRRRWAYIWVHLVAAGRPEFEPAAARAVDDWQAAEQAAARDSVLIAAGYLPPGRD